MEYAIIGLVVWVVFLTFWNFRLSQLAESDANHNDKEHAWLTKKCFALQIELRDTQGQLIDLADIAGLEPEYVPEGTKWKEKA